tara:strand:- start:81 stop:899 length:819 start_codon:yes stop_codon:yes gene_type:complete
LRVACLQTVPKPTIDDALEEAISLANEAEESKVDFIFLPEYCGGLKSDGALYRPPAAKEEHHIFLRKFKDFCKEKSVWCCLGSIAIDSGENKIINRGFIIDNSGHVVSRYDKIHMFDISLKGEEHKESDTVKPGNKAVILKTKYGVIGHTICYDLRFPSLYRELCQNGAQILLAPAAFTRKTGAAHWHILNQCRAIENGAFVISPCAIGDIEGGGGSYGHSLIIDPWGQVIADGGDKRGVVIADINIELVNKVRDQLPSLAHDRNFEVLKCE